MKNFILLFCGIIFSNATFAQQDSVVFESATTLPYYENIDDVKLAMSKISRKEILKTMKFQSPNYYRKYRNGQRLNRWGSGFILVGSGYLLTYTVVMAPSMTFDAVIAVPIVAASVLGGGITMVCLGQKYKRKAINNFAEDIYNGKAHLTKNSIKSEFNINFTGNGMGLLLNF